MSRIANLSTSAKLAATLLNLTVLFNMLPEISPKYGYCHFVGCFYIPLAFTKTKDKVAETASSVKSDAKEAASAVKALTILVDK